MPLGIEVGLSPENLVLDGDPAPPQKGGRALQRFQPMFIVAKRLDGSKRHLAWRYVSAQAICLRWGPNPLPKEGRSPPPQFSAHFYCGQTAGCIKMPLGMEIGLSLGDFVLDGIHPPQRGSGAPQFSARFMSIAANGCMDQDAT